MLPILPVHMTPLAPGPVGADWLDRPTIRSKRTTKRGRATFHDANVREFASAAKIARKSSSTSCAAYGAGASCILEEYMDACRMKCYYSLANHCILQAAVASSSRSDCSIHSLKQHEVNPTRTRSSVTSRGEGLEQVFCHIYMPQRRRTWITMCLNFIALDQSRHEL